MEWVFSSFKNNKCILLFYYSLNKIITIYKNILYIRIYYVNFHWFRLNCYPTSMNKLLKRLFFFIELIGLFSYVAFSIMSMNKLTNKSFKLWHLLCIMFHELTKINSHWHREREINKFMICFPFTSPKRYITKKIQAIQLSTTAKTLLVYFNVLVDFSLF